jgi:dihydrofolate synthase/folylpolyglutamate synthase
MAFNTYQEAVDWITGLVPFGIKPGLLRMNDMMERLDHPERRLKFIHVAGTNGKGSTCAYLSNVLHNCGYDVGSFNSPFITRYTDRIRLNGVDIPDELVLLIANQIKELSDELAQTELGGLTSFEVTTVLAIVYFARHAYPDFVVWETGLGGREDCTNIVTPIISVITNVGHDHMDILGNSLEKIAAEKAGIIKHGVPVVTTVTQPEVITVIEQAATQRQSRLYLYGRDYQVQKKSMELNRLTYRFEGPFRHLEELTISLNGEHQMYNSALAVMTLEVLRQYYAVLVDEEHLQRGLIETKWPGRLELMSEQPRLLIDGAHNPEGAESLSSALQQIYEYDKLHFMIGMLSTKSHSDYLWHILPIVDTLIVSEPDFRKKLDAAELAKLVEKVRQERGKPHLQVLVEPNWKLALEQLQRLTSEQDLAVVSGTLYMISDVRSWMLHQKISEKGW